MAASHAGRVDSHQPPAHRDSDSSSTATHPKPPAMQASAAFMFTHSARNTMAGTCDARNARKKADGEDVASDSCVLREAGSDEQ